MPGFATFQEKTPASAAIGIRTIDAVSHARVSAPPAASPPPAAAANVRAMQRLVGNQTVMRMLDARRTVASPAAVQQHHDDEDEVQRDVAGLAEPSDQAIRSAAAEGVRTPSSPLPFLDQIQASFGRHPVTQVQAHVGPQAAEASRAMNARAYASGDHVVFGGAPDLRTTAHEAAHVVQQRAGVQLSGGVGRVGDAYERHADAVADAVVAGRSAEEMLEGMAGTGGAPTVQRAWARFGMDAAPSRSVEESMELLAQHLGGIGNVQYAAYDPETDSVFVVRNGEAFTGERVSGSWVWTPRGAQLAEVAARLETENGLDLEQDVLKLVREEPDLDALEWIAGFGKTKLPGRRNTIAQWILKQFRDGVLPSELKSEFDRFDALKGVELRPERGPGFDAWTALADYYLTGENIYNLYHSLSDPHNLAHPKIPPPDDPNAPDRKPEVVAAMKAVAEELKPPPLRGRGGAGTLVVGTGTSGEVSVAGRPAFEQDAQNLAGMRGGFHRRHILAWHSIRGGTEKVVNQLLADGATPAQVNGIFERFLARMGVDRGADELDNIRIALSALNSNVRNLWPGEGYQNSLINLYQRMLRDWAGELEGKDERAVEEWYARSGNIVARIQGKHGTGDPNAAQYERAIGDLALFVESAVRSQREAGERARTPGLDEVGRRFQQLAGDNPPPLVRNNLEAIHASIGQFAFDPAAFAEHVRGMEWTEGGEMPVEHTGVRDQAISIVRQRHFFDVDHAARRPAGDEIAALLLSAADNLEVDFSFEGAATPRRFARGASRDYLDQYMQANGLDWRNEANVKAACEADPDFARLYEEAQQNVGRFLDAVTKMLVWAENGPASGDAARLAGEFDQFLVDFMGVA